MSNKWIVVLVIVIVFAIFFGIYYAGYCDGKRVGNKEGYKAGQIDAIQGKVKYTKYINEEWRLKE